VNANKLQERQLQVNLDLDFRLLLAIFNFFFCFFRFFVGKSCLVSPIAISDGLDRQDFLCRIVTAFQIAREISDSQDFFFVCVVISILKFKKTIFCCVHLNCYT
jgi:hypothetical protein